MTNTNMRVVGTGNHYISLSDVMIQADTEGGNTKLILPSIAEMNNYKQKSGNSLTQSQFFFSKTGDGNLTISANQTGDVNYVNGVESITMSAPKVSGSVIIASNDDWGLTYAPLNSPLTPTINMGEAASYVVLTPSSLSLSSSPLLATGNVGQAAVAITPNTILFLDGVNLKSPRSDNAVADLKNLFGTILGYTRIFNTYNFQSGSVNLGTVNVGHGAGVFTSQGTVGDGAGIYKGNNTCITNTDGIVTLSGNGDFIFVFDGSIAIGENTIFRLINEAEASRVYFLSQDSIEIGADAIVKGNFISSNSILTGANVNLEGRLLASSGRVNIGEFNSLNVPKGSIIIQPLIF